MQGPGIRHLSAAARMEGLKDYQLLEKIALEYLKRKHPYTTNYKPKEESEEEPE